MLSKPSDSKFCCSPSSGTDNSLGGGLLQQSLLRRGAIAPLSLILMILLIFAAAFGIEIGRHLTVKAELQRAADAAALAGCWELINGRDQDGIRGVIAEVVSRNSIAAKSPDIGLNSLNSPNGEIVFGRYNFDTKKFDPTAVNPNAVRVVVQRNKDRNGEIHSLFGSLLGPWVSQSDAMHGFHARAFAAFSRDIRGFTAPPPNQTLGVLPFVVRESEWDAMLSGGGVDELKYDSASGLVMDGPDGIPELNMFPHITGLAGNSGTVNIGTTNNSTNELRRQVVHGLNASDLANLGGKLEIGPDGILSLTGDPGISAGMTFALEEIIGKTRVLPLYRNSGGTGNNAYFEVVRFVGVRIMEVDLTGSKHVNKRIIIQPADIRMSNTIQANQPGASQFVYPKNPVILVD